MNEGTACRVDRICVSEVRGRDGKWALSLGCPSSGPCRGHNWGPRPLGSAARNQGALVGEVQARSVFSV